MSNSVEILNVRIDDVTIQEVLAKITVFIESGGYHTLSFANPEIVMFANKEPFYREFINNASLVVADGVGLLLASRLLRKPLRERVTGTDMMYSLGALSAKKGYSLFFLGGKAEVVNKAVENLKKIYPGVNICGFYHGYFGEEEERKIIKEIKDKKPDILIVCLGMYKQEMWIEKHFDELKVPVCFGNGGAIDFVAGKLPRAPEWMLNSGLEWMYRLWKEPWRIKRQWLLPLFILKVIYQKYRSFFRQKSF